MTGYWLKVMYLKIRLPIFWMINHQITKLLHNVYQKNKAKFTHLETGKPMTFVGGDGIWFFWIW